MRASEGKHESEGQDEDEGEGGGERGGAAPAAQPGSGLAQVGRLPGQRAQLERPLYQAPCLGRDELGTRPCGALHSAECLECTRH